MAHDVGLAPMLFINPNSLVLLCITTSWFVVFDVLFRRFFHFDGQYLPFPLWEGNLRSLYWTRPSLIPTDFTSLWNCHSNSLVLLALESYIG